MALKGIKCFEDVTSEKADEFAKEFHKLIGVSEPHEAPNGLWRVLLSDKEEREEVFKKFLQLTSSNVDIDWFNIYYQWEHADRRNQKQDFTPPTLAKLMSTIIRDDNEGGVCYEPCAGTGSIIIQDWNEQRLKYSPFTYSPMEHYYVLEEKSGRAIPFLLFNLAIRGMNATVLHADTITRECKGVFFVHNIENDPMAFSNIHIVPESEMVANEYSIKYVKNDYKPHVEANWIDSPEVFNRAMARHERILEGRRRAEEEDNPVVRQLIELFGI